jgi:hypothetical protein
MAFYDNNHGHRDRRDNGRDRDFGRNRDRNGNGRDQRGQSRY